MLSFGPPKGKRVALQCPHCFHDNPDDAVACENCGGAVVVGPAGPPFLVIHSLSDEIFPLEPLRKFIRFCEEQGLRIELHPVPGLSHYAYDSFVPALREAVPWLKGVWEAK